MTGVTSNLSLSNGLFQLGLFAAVHSATLFLPRLQRCISTERSMAQQVPSRLVVRFLQGPPSGPKFRWRLGNSSTKVLFRHPNRPSTFVPPAAAPALILFITGRQLSLRARNPQIGDVTT